MTYISGEYSFHRLERLYDATGISGTGTVAYVVDLGRDGQLMLWDTNFGEDKEIPSHGIEILRSQILVEMIHGHDGATMISPLTNSAHQVRVEHLLGIAAPRIQAVAARLDTRPELGEGPRDGKWFRTGRSNPRNLYLAVGGKDWKKDLPVGSMYQRRMGVLAVDALNDYCEQHPGLVPRYRSQLVSSEDSASSSIPTESEECA